MTLDEFFKEQIDQADSDLVMFDENGTELKALIERRDIIDAIENNDGDYYEDDEEIYLSDLEEEDLDSYMDDDSYEVEYKEEY